MSYNINPESFNQGMRQPEGYGAFDNQDEIEFPRRINLDKIDKIAYEDIDYEYYPCPGDAFIISAFMNGVEMTDEERDDLNENYRQWVYDIFLYDNALAYHLS